MEKNLTPMMKQYLETKKEFPDGILLFRAGDFYEMFYDDAKIASQILNITLTKRGKNETEAPLAGIPYHALDPYVSKLIKAGKKVVICEQIEDPKFAKGLVKRAVTRIITPSTVFTDNYENNYLCSISKQKESFGFSLIDITTGEFKTNTFNTFSEILNELSLIKPKELIITKNILDNFDQINLIKKSISNVIINYTDNLDIGISKAKLLDHFGARFNSFGIIDQQAIVSSYNAIKYLKDTQFLDLKYINTIKEYNLNKYIKIDRKTAANLEIVSNLRDNSTNNSLFSIINNTKTALGHRKLYFDLLHPLTDKQEILELNLAVKEIKENVFLQEELSQQLSYIGDLEKIISKIGFGNCNPRDLIALKQSLQIIPNIKTTLQDGDSNKLKEIRENLVSLNNIVKLIDAGVVDSPPLSIREGGFIKPQFSKELYDITNINKTTNSWLMEYEAELKQKTNIKSLKLKFNKIFGYYIEIPKAQAINLPEYLERKQTLVNCERYTTIELSEKESMVMHAKERREELEYSIFLEICKEILSDQESIRELAKYVAQLDELYSFAYISNKNDYCIPKLDNSDIVQFKDLRHPLIEQQHSFIPNDCNLDLNNRTMIITGPNMAGKSSYMRSVCLSLIIGHTGCFIPATAAHIGEIDAIYTRVGASDDIIHGQSTFLVEMSEVAYILNNATKDSVVILDEIGRGTSTFDGISIAWSVVKYFNNTIKCKTLLATHYHILNKMEETNSGICNYHVTAKEEGDSLHFYHKLQKGGINKSYGIQVAKLAGVNKEIIDSALAIQKDLENNSFLKKNEL
ncbi:MAG: DNA mismatch repair protein MutS [archaeon]|jgi:DNA mismatch repair protein MutS